MNEISETSDWSMTPKVNELAAALAKAQGTIQNAPKDATNPFYSSRYATLASVLDACRPALSANGLAVLQFPGFDPELNLVSVRTCLAHSSGQYVSATLTASPGDEPTAQKIGSAISYLRRYGLQSLICLASDDDDGAAASGTAMTAAQKAIAEKKIEEFTKKAAERESAKPVKADLPKEVIEFGKIVDQIVASDQDVTRDEIIGSYFKTAKGKVLTGADIEQFHSPKQLRWLKAGVEELRQRFSTVLDPTLDFLDRTE